MADRDTRTKMTDKEVAAVQRHLKGASIVLDHCMQDDLAKQVRAISRECARRMFGVTP